MKIKDYKKQLNESIEVIDIHDKISSVAKEKSFEVKQEKAKTKVSGRKIAIFVSSFAVVVLVCVLSIPLILSGGVKHKEMMENSATKEAEPNYTETHSSYESDSTPMAEQKTGASYSEATAYPTAVVEPTGSAPETELEPSEIKGNLVDTYQMYLNSSENDCFDYEEFTDLYNSFLNDETVDEILNAKEYSAQEIEDIEIISSLLN